MPLDMKPVCQRCEGATSADGEAFICSHECTFCPSCSAEMRYRCPNCGGELVPRPRRSERQLA